MPIMYIYLLSLLDIFALDFPFCPNMSSDKDSEEGLPGLQESSWAQMNSFSPISHVLKKPSSPRCWHPNSE